MGIRVRDENEEQLAVYRWWIIYVRQNPKLRVFDFHHSPNEGKRSARFGANLKHSGMQRGFEDIFIAIPSGKYHGLFVELKSMTGKVTPEQILMQARHCEMGYASCVRYGASSAIQTIIDYLHGNEIL